MRSDKILLRTLWSRAVPPGIQWKRWARLLVGSLVGAWCLMLVIRNLRLDHFKRDIGSMELSWIVAALAAIAVEYVCRIERWRRMLRHESPSLRWIDCAGPFLASYATNNVLPFRAGDILRTFAFEQILCATPGVVAATLLVERILDMFVLVALLSGLLLSFGSALFGHLAFGSFLLIPAVIAGITVLLFPRLLETMLPFLSRLTRWLFPKLSLRIIPEIHKGLLAFVNITARREVIYLLALTAVAWMCEGYIFWFCAKALPSLSSPGASWLALPMGALTTLIPSTPGYVGTFEYFVVLAMTTLGNSAAAAAEYSFLVHVVLSAPTIFAGGLYLLFRFAKQPGELPTP